MFGFIVGLLNDTVSTTEVINHLIKLGSGQELGINKDLF
jgi:hypothetical protein